MMTMAKYKFTKTIKPNEGICIGANGTVSKLPIPSAPMLKSVVADARVEKSRITISTASSKWDRPHKNHKWVRPKRFVSPNPDLISAELKPRKKPKAKPHHGKRTFHGGWPCHTVSSARPGGMFGVFCPKPINRTAAMSFQNR
jgi:hypothetical protein